MYNLAKKKLRQDAQREEQEDHVPMKLIDLLDQGKQREEKYVKMIQTLKQQKQQQAKQYISKLQQFSKFLTQMHSKKQRQDQKKQFKSLEMRKQQYAKTRPQRTSGKKEYTIEDINRFSLEIEIKFLFFLPVLQDPISDYYPKKIEIKFNNLGLNYVSGQVSYDHTQEQCEQMLKQGQPFQLQSTSVTKNVCFTLSLQTSQSRSFANLKQLMLLMKRQLLQIEVYDYDSKILYGLCYLNLQQLLFYDRGQDYWVQQVDLFSPLKNSNVGKFHIQLRNSKAPANLNSTDEKVVVQSPDKKLTVTSVTPLQPQITYDIRSNQQRQRRLLRRINQAKQQNMKLGKSVYMNFQYDYIKNQMNSRKLDHIIKLKQSNKFLYSEQVLSKIHNEFHSYESSIGNPLLLHFKFTNNFDQDMDFQIVLSQHFKQIKQLQLITNSMQYEYYKRQAMLPGHVMNIDERSLSFSLAPSESLYILAKYLSWTPSSDKSADIHIHNAYNNQIVQTFVFKVKTIPQIIDNKFRIFQGQGKVTQISIPFNDNRQYSQPYLYCDNTQIEYHWARDHFSVRFKVNKTQDIIIYIYQSNQCRKLLKCFKLIIEAFTICQFNSLEIGIQKTVQIDIPSQKEAMEVKFYSSDPKKIWTHLTRPLKIKQDTVQSISITGRSFTMNDQNIILSCNKKSGQIVFQWLFRFKMIQPTFKNILQIIASTSKKTAYALDIYNPNQRTQPLAFVSSNFSYVQIPQSKKVLNPGKTSFVNLTILPHPFSQKQIIINMSNFDQTLNVNYLLQIKFTDKFKQKQQDSQQVEYRRY